MYFVANYCKSTQNHIRGGRVFKCEGTILHNTIEEAEDYARSVFKNWQIYSLSVRIRDFALRDKGFYLLKEVLIMTKVKDF